MRAESKVYAGLTVSCAAGAVEFVDGAAEVTEAQAKALRKLPESIGVTVGGSPGESTKPEGNGAGGASGSSEEPNGNAKLEDWQAYAVAKGVPAEKLTDLKREEIKQLLAE